MFKSTLSLIIIVLEGTGGIDFIFGVILAVMVSGPRSITRVSKSAAADRCCLEGMVLRNVAWLLDHAMLFYSSSAVVVSCPALCVLHC